MKHTRCVIILLPFGRFRTDTAPPKKPWHKWYSHHETRLLCTTTFLISQPHFIGHLTSLASLSHLNSRSGRAARPWQQEDLTIGDREAEVRLHSSGWQNRLGEVHRALKA